MFLEPFVILPERVYTSADNGMQGIVRVPEPELRIYSHLALLAHYVGDGGAGTIDLSLRSAFHADLAISPSWEFYDFLQRAGTFTGYTLNRVAFAVGVTDFLVGEGSNANAVALGAYIKPRLTISSGSHTLGVWGYPIP